MRNQTHTKRSSGFTLIELMVAMGITAIIITVLVTLTSIAADTWTRSRDEIRASRQAKVMLNTMAQDLESLVLRSGNDFEWLHAKIDSTSLPPVSSRGGGSGTIGLTFLTAATDRYLGQVGSEFPENSGDVSCASYRLRFKDPIAGGNDDRTSTYVLYRLLVDPDDAFTDLLGQSDLDSAFSSYESGIDDQENFICENVHQFSLAFHVEVADPDDPLNVRTARVVLGGASGSGEFRVTGSGIESTVSVDGFDEEEIRSGRLKAVEVSMSVISDGGIARRNARDGLDQKDYARNSYHYSRMIELPGL